MGPGPKYPGLFTSCLCTLDPELQDRQADVCALEFGVRPAISPANGSRGDVSLPASHWLD